MVNYRLPLDFDGLATAAAEARENGASYWK
jgi:hypothetical protein